MNGALAWALSFYPLRLNPALWLRSLILRMHAHSPFLSVRMRAAVVEFRLEKGREINRDWCWVLDIVSKSLGNLEGCRS